jgi:hypothetical protein
LRVFHALKHFHAIDAEQVAAQDLAEIEHARSRPQRAVSIVGEILPAVRAGNDKIVLVSLLVNLAAYLITAGDLDGADAAAGEAIGVRAAREPENIQVAIAIERMALISALRGDLVRAALLEGYAEAAMLAHRFVRDVTEAPRYDRLMALFAKGCYPRSLPGIALTERRSRPMPRSPLALGKCEST